MGIEGLSPLESMYSSTIDADIQDEISIGPTTQSLITSRKCKWQRGVQCLPLLSVIRFFERYSHPGSTVNLSLSTLVYNPRILLWNETLGAGIDAEVNVINTLDRPLARKHFTRNNTVTSPASIYKELVVLAYTSVDRSPHLVTMFGVDPYYSSAYFSIFVEYASCGTLTKYMASTSHNTVQAIQFCREIIMGMIYLHNLEILHNDLKSDNILIFKSGAKVVSKVADFGHAIYPFTKMTLKGVQRLFGTKKWAPPEFLVAPDSISVFGPSSDIYTFGFVIACLAAWSDPFEGTTVDIMSRWKGEDGAILRSLPEAIKTEQAWSAELLKKCFKKDPKKRWEIASDMLTAEGITSDQMFYPYWLNLHSLSIQSASPNRHLGSELSLPPFSQFLDGMETVNINTVIETVIGHLKI
jgi:serine/threonine protein kinase